jgi:hypothetical protein
LRLLSGSPSRTLFRVQWLVIHLISITVAGAAPGLDESAPDFPFYSVPLAPAALSGRRARDEHLTPREACLRRLPGVKTIHPARRVA